MRHLVILIILSACQCREPMLRESDVADSPVIGLPLLGLGQTQLDWAQMDGASVPETTTSSSQMLVQPDSTGLIGGLLDGRPMLALNLWANQRRSQLKPRRKDMHEASLMRLLGSDYQPTWMRKSREGVNQEYPVEERPAVRALRQLMQSENTLSDLRLPTGLSSEAREIVVSWLVKRATCPVRFVWADLGPYFWPRWLRRGECGRSGGDVDDITVEGVRGLAPVEDEDDDYGNVDALGARANRGRNMTELARSCSWPPGMKCVPGVARTLHLLRWHCRLRKHSSTRANYNTIMSGPLAVTGKVSARSGGKPKSNGRQKRSKYRCVWIKVPYSVPEDCVCSV